MKVLARRVSLLLVLMLALPARAQMQHDQQAEISAELEDGDDRAQQLMLKMQSPSGVPWSRQVGTGTGWQPTSSPMFGWMNMGDRWNVRANLLMFGGLDWQTGPRGSFNPFSTNWFMVMTRTRLLGGQFSLRGTFSLEPYTVADNGYPLLLQTGESFRGQPIVDRQHPNDLTMEVGVLYQRAIIPEFGWELYVAPAGDPALGPPPFPHRFSAYGDPFAPLGHQWMDATHISFGVITAGFYGPRVKFEGSVFNGHEPDEDRRDIEFNGLQSLAGRLSFAPTPSVAMQASFGYLVGPNALAPKQNVRRITASIMWNKPLVKGNWATTAIWGHNEEIGQGSTDAALIETTVEKHQNVFFNRLEYVRKTGAELNLSGAFRDETFPIGSLVLGYIRNLPPLGDFVVGVGARVAVNVAGGGLGYVYGTSVPVGGALYIRIRPKTVDMGQTPSGLGLPK